jgi:nascent polypeptide-associated complex subunit alpha
MFGGGGGGLNPRKMQQMMDQMGIDMDELDAEEVVIRTADEELYFGEGVDVTCMSAQGQDTYQVVGEPERRERGAGEAAGAVESGSAGGEDAPGVSEDDVDLVATRAGVEEATARDALEANDGDLAAAIASLE